MQGSYFQSSGYESRVLTTTPWGQMNFEAKLNKTKWTLKIQLFSETSINA